MISNQIWPLKNRPWEKQKASQAGLELWGTSKSQGCCFWKRPSHKGCWKGSLEPGKRFPWQLSNSDTKQPDQAEPQPAPQQVAERRQLWCRVGASRGPEPINIPVIKERRAGEVKLPACKEEAWLSQLVKNIVGADIKETAGWMTSRSLQSSMHYWYYNEMSMLPDS